LEPVTEPTTSPAGGPVWRRPDRRLLRVRRVLVLLWATLPGVVAAGVLLVLRGPVEAAAAVLVTAALTGLLLVAVQRRFAAWGYLEREDDLLVRRGVLVRRTSVVPYGRMQYVDVTAGPLDRRMGLATVTLHTAAAATDASVPGLLAPEAARLRDRLAALGEARQAGV
jgi:membrane protein YdbS with pleckstrin-like domain